MVKVYSMTISTSPNTARLRCSIWSTSVYLPAPSSDPGNQSRLSAFQDIFNNCEHRLDTLFYYRILVPTFRLHHQTLKIIHDQNNKAPGPRAALSSRHVTCGAARAFGNG
ncbi:hypothetical protein EVAR_35485_1 [Eumeta japonica]|uniref:Uncharacterized protein n=1 Tax=Eumeta variegata TaxID=151549 RepID=A0A4C1X900_EUMVA|nr:hypothetical protein EVAR_35485_1 [Eumeta japonica]